MITVLLSLFFLLASPLAVRTALAATLSNLESPAFGSFRSGVNAVSGWSCNASQIDIEINGISFPAPYGIDRQDTAPICGHPDNGFSLLINWNQFGDGEHSVRALADGEEFANGTVTVITLGVEFLSGASGEYTLPDFPQAGTEVTVRWEEAWQNFVIAEGAGGGDGSGGEGPQVLLNPQPGSFQSGIG